MRFYGVRMVFAHDLGKALIAPNIEYYFELCVSWEGSTHMIDPQLWARQTFILKTRTDCRDPETGVQPHLPDPLLFWGRSLLCTGNPQAWVRCLSSWDGLPTGSPMWQPGWDACPLQASPFTCFSQDVAGPEEKKPDLGNCIWSIKHT